VIETPGAATNEAIVEETIRELCNTFDVREVAFDPYGARRMITRLIEDGLPVTEFRQGWITMSPAIQTFEKQVLSRRIRHDNPVLSWCLMNVVLDIDKAENRSFSKKKARDRIDLAVAATMAVARAVADEQPALSVYDTDARPSGLLVL
jgi:phage terminase large subunit-like protein